MGTIQQQFPFGSPATGPNGFNPADAAAGPVFVLSETNNIRCRASATQGSGVANMIRSVFSRSSGKVYAEFDIISVGSTATGVGVATSLADLLAITDSVAGHAHCLWRSDGAFFDAGFGTGGAAFTFVATNVVALAIDFSGKTVRAYKGNVLQNTWTWTPSVPAFFLWMSSNAINAETRMLTQSTNQHFTPPAGYTAWDG